MARRRNATADQNIRLWDQEPVTKPWLELTMELFKTRSPDPPMSARGQALLSVAVNDAVISAWHWKYVYNRAPPTGVGGSSPPGPDPSYPSEHATVAGAASRVLEFLFPERPAAKIEQLASDAAGSRVQAGATFRSDADQGLALGRSVAELVIARGRTDGSETRWDGRRPPPGPASWAPRPGTSTLPVEPLAGAWRTWLLPAGSALRPGPPAALGSPELAAGAARVLEAQAHLTPEQRHAAGTWSGGSGGPSVGEVWDRTLLEMVQRDHLSLPRTARDFALLDVAQADAGIAAWDGKYAYWSPRPENAIRDLGLNPAFVPLEPTPSSPGYPAGRAAESAAAGDVLADLFPRDAASLLARVGEATQAGLYGGTSFPSDLAAGAAIGHQVGRLALDRAGQDGAGR